MGDRWSALPGGAPSPRAVRVGAAGGTLHLVLLVFVGSLFGGHSGPLTNPENAATVVTLLVLFAALASVVLRVERADPSDTHLLWGVAAVLCAAVLGLAVALVGRSGPPAHSPVLAAQSYLFGLALLFYVYGGAVVVGAVPAMLWAEHRVWLPLVVTGATFALAVAAHWRFLQETHQPLLLPTPTPLLLYTVLWFLVALAALSVGVLERAGRAAVRRPEA